MKKYEEIKNRISIADYLKVMAIAVNKNMFSAVWRGERTPSVHILEQGRKWYDFGTYESGSVIDLCAKVENISVAEAVERLSSDFSFLAIDHTPTKPKNEEKNPIIIDSVTEAITHPRLIHYLENVRRIPPQVYQSVLYEIRFHFHRTPKNILYGFGLPTINGGWTIRIGSDNYSHTKYAVGGQSFSLIETSCTKLVVFEGLCDYLSFLASCRDAACYSAVVLNSVNNAPKLIEYLGKKKYGFTSIGLMLDNDTAGQATTAKLLAEIPDGGKVLREKYGLKDCNTDLMSFFLSKRKYPKQAKDLNAMWKYFCETEQPNARNAIRSCWCCANRGRCEGRGYITRDKWLLFGNNCSEYKKVIK
jgi:hypothetical protein